MIKVCEICGSEFDSKGTPRKYCYECSPTQNGVKSSTSCHQKTQLRRAMKKQAVKEKGGKCSICGYNKCIEALQFHHLDFSEKEFPLSNGNTRSWDKYKKELEKCILVCGNCHVELHVAHGYLFE